MTTYYVSRQSGASDNNSGTSTSSPWYSLSKVNYYNLQPGDVVRFRRGDTWYGRLYNNKNGTSSARITYADYGTGTKPTINATGEGDGADIYGDYITLENLRLHSANNNGVIVRSGADYCTIRSCEIWNVGAGIYHSGFYGITEYCYIHNTVMKTRTQGGDDDGGANPIQLFRSYGIVRYNDFRFNCDWSWDYNYDGGAVEVYSPTGRTLDNTQIYGNYFYQNWGVIETGGTKDESLSYPNSLPTVQNVYIHHNVFHNNYGRVLTIHGASTYRYAAKTYNLRVENNTIVENGDIEFDPEHEDGRTISNDGTTIWVRQTVNAGEIVWRNNILYKTYGSVADYGQIHTHNCYYGGVSTSYSYGTGEFNSNPLFVNYGGEDYHLQSGSPCRNAGTNTGYGQDYDGTLLPQESVYDIGAFEYYSGGGGTAPGTVAAFVGELTAAGPKGDAWTEAVSDYALNDRFLTDMRDLPSSVRECEPGPGILDIYDYRDFVITDGELQMGSYELNWQDHGFVARQSWSRLNGRCFTAKIRVAYSGGWIFGLHDSPGLPGQPSNYSHALYQRVGETELCEEKGGRLQQLTIGVEFNLMIVLGSTRTKYFYYYNSQWKLLWTGADVDSTLYFMMAAYDAGIYIDDLRVFNQDAPYDTDFGLADYTNQNPSVGTKFYHDPGGIFVEFIISAHPASGTAEATRLAVKRGDNDNLWFIEIGASTEIRLVERRNAINTYRITNFTTTVGDRVLLRVEGNTFTLYLNEVRLASHTSDGFLANEDGGMYGGFYGVDGGSIRNLYSWPLNPTGARAPVLHKTYPLLVSANTGAMVVDTPQGDAYELRPTQRIYPVTAGLKVRGQRANPTTSGRVQAGVGELTAATNDGTVAPGAATIRGFIGALYFLPTQHSTTPAVTILAATGTLTATGEHASGTGTNYIRPSTAELTASGEQANAIVDVFISAGTGKLRAAGQYAFVGIELKQRLHPWEVAHAGNWVRNDGNSLDLWKAIDEFSPDHTDYIKSDGNPVSSPVVFKLEGSFDPQAIHNHVLQYTFRREGSGTLNLTVELREGYVDESTRGTLIGSWSHTSVGDTIIHAYKRLAIDQAAAISDYTDLYVRFVATT